MNTTIFILRTHSRNEHKIDGRQSSPHALLLFWIQEEPAIVHGQLLILDFTACGWFAGPDPGFGHKCKKAIEGEQNC